MNMVFVGNPGTGKTSIAKLTAKYFKVRGVMPTNRFVYRAASQMIQGVVGGTAEKIREAAEEARGGVLFIDEFQGFNEGHSAGNIAENVMREIVSKALQEKITGIQQEIDRRMDRLPGILNEDGYPDVQAFKKTYDAATALVEQYNRDLAAWERQVHGGQQTQQKPPEKGSIRKKLRDMEAEAKRRNAERRQEPRHRSYDYDRGR